MRILTMVNHFFRTAKLPDFSVIFTGRNEVGPRQCFYRRLWFCPQGGEGCLPQCMLGYHHPPGTRTLLGADTPPGKQTPAYDQWAAGMHPTGMHCCFFHFPSIFTTRKRSLGQGNIFAPVCHSVHRGGGMCGCSWGVCVVLFGRVCGFIRGACVILFGGCAWFYLGEGCVWFYSGGMRGFIRGACMVLFGGACVVFSVFLDTMRYGQWAGGTHPTGIHSCFNVLFFWLKTW